MEKLKALFNRYREIIMYLIFGVITTLVSKAVQIFILWFGENIIGITSDDDGFYWVRTAAIILQWVAGVLTAFFTNRKWVFNSADTGKRAMATQFVAFVGSRVATLGLEFAVTMGTVLMLDKLFFYKPFELFGIAVTSDLISIVVSAVFVVVSNYFISKFFVFAKKKKQIAKETEQGLDK